MRKEKNQDRQKRNEVKERKTNRETYMTDIAATIAALLKIQMPNGNVGHVISEVLK